MQLEINNRIIDSDIGVILRQLKYENNTGLLNNILNAGDNYRITCPYHKEGHENHPSMNVYAREDNDNVPYGFCRCFTCGTAVPLYQLVADCLGISIDDGKQWLIDRFGNIFADRTYNLSDIVLKKEKPEYLDEDILNNFAYYHPYLETRHINIDTAIKFKLGYNKEKDVITFPVWDASDNLVMITERSVKTKQFHIPATIDKPVYLLNYINRENITTVIVCESQINTLTCWQYGYPAIGLFGTGSKKQYDILNKCGIRHYILAFDGDDAGHKGEERFKQNIRKDVIVDSIVLPLGKDVNDITQEEFLNLLKNI